MKERSRWVAAAGALALGAALTVHLVSASGGAVRSGRVVVHHGALGTPLEEVRGDLVDGPALPAQRLGAAAFAPLVGAVAPVAVQSADGRYLAYDTFAYARPVDREKSYADQGIRPGAALGLPRIRLRDLGTGSETPLEPGSQSPAWRSDGALAYVVGAPPEDRADQPYLADVVVRATADAAPVTWTETADRYLVLGWAGRTLLVQRDAPGAPPDVLAFDGPDSVRTLAPSASLVAISPDGAEAVVADSPAASATPRVQLVRVSDADVVGEAFVADARDPVTGAPLTWILGRGAWADDHVVAPASSGLVVLHVGDGLSIEQVLRVDSATKPEGALYEPRFADGDASTIVAWAAVHDSDPVRFAQIACDRTALTCTQGPAVAADAIPHPVDASGGAR